MGKKIYILKIQSISDIITNSSSEVFVLNGENDRFKDLFSALTGYHQTWFDFIANEEDLKKFLVKCFDDYQTEMLSDALDSINPLETLRYDIEYYEEKGFTKEKLVDFFLPFYKNLIGTVFFEADDSTIYNNYELDHFFGVMGNCGAVIKNYRV